MESKSVMYKELCNLHLGDEHYLSAHEKEGKIEIHIRKFQKFSVDGRIYPTKKGVILTPSDWLVLESYMDAINEAFARRASLETDQKWHIGNDIFITVSKEYPTVDIRRFWKPSEGEDYRATKNGAALTIRRWNSLRDAQNIIRDFVPQLDEVSNLSSTLPF